MPVTTVQIYKCDICDKETILPIADREACAPIGWVTYGVSRGVANLPLTGFACPNCFRKMQESRIIKPK